MRIEQLKYLINIGKTKAMNVTSTNMHISPQALSAAIKSLETELDFRLVDRSPHGAELTVIGKKLADLSEEYILKLDELLSDKNAGNEKKLFFELYCLPYCEADNFMPKLVNDLTQKQDKFNISIAEKTEDEILSLLLNDKIEVALGYLYFIDDRPLLPVYSEFDYKVLYSFKYCYRTLESSHFAKYSSVSLKNIFEHPLVQLNYSECISFEEIMKNLAADLDCKCELTNFKRYSVFKEFLFTSNGGTIIPILSYKKNSDNEFIPKTIDIPIKEHLHRELIIIYKKNKSSFNDNTVKLINRLEKYLNYVLK